MISEINKHTVIYGVRFILNPAATIDDYKKACEKEIIRIVGKEEVELLVMPFRGVPLEPVLAFGEEEEGRWIPFTFGPFGRPLCAGDVERWEAPRVVQGVALLLSPDDKTKVFRMPLAKNENSLPRSRK